MLSARHRVTCGVNVSLFHCAMKLFSCSTNEAVKFNSCVQYVVCILWLISLPVRFINCHVSTLTADADAMATAEVWEWRDRTGPASKQKPYQHHVFLLKRVRTHREWTSQYCWICLSAPFVLSDSMPQRRFFPVSTPFAAVASKAS